LLIKGVFRGERIQLGHGAYWTKTISATCYGKKKFYILV
jgi:hypothetical protein